jgi:hypothetical protein
MVKNKILTLIAVLGLVLGLSAVSVKADSGFAIGITGNVASFDTTGTETETTGDTETTTTTVTEDVTYSSVFVEGVFQGEQLGITVGASYIPGEAELGAKTRTDTDDKDAAENDDGTYTAKAEISDHFSIYLEPTFYAKDNLGLYVKGGVSRVTINTLESIAVGADSSTYGNEDVFGTIMGVGARIQSAGGVFFKLEYTETDYEDITLTSTTGNKNKITADADQDAVNFSIGYKF